MSQSSNPPQVVTIERAWSDLLAAMIYKNPGLVRQNTVAIKAIRSLMRGG